MNSTLMPSSDHLSSQNLDERKTFSRPLQSKRGQSHFSNRPRAVSPRNRSGKHNFYDKDKQIAPFHNSSPNESLKRRKCQDVPSPITEEQIPQLDPTNPVHAKRMKQRKSAVEKGKNTVGYDEYCRKVPKSQRRPRSLECPSTPDYKADIPNRRWLGQISAWRRALHRFDPPEMSVRKVTEDTFTATGNTTVKPAMPQAKSVQEQQIAEAEKKNLPVDFNIPSTSTPINDRIREYVPVSACTPNTLLPDGQEDWKTRITSGEALRRVLRLDVEGESIDSGDTKQEYIWDGEKVSDDDEANHKFTTSSEEGMLLDFEEDSDDDLL